MTDAITAFKQAHTDLDDWGNAVTCGATTAPDLIMRAIIALRTVLHRHPAVDIGSAIICSTCKEPAPCAEVQPVLAALGVPDNDDQ